MVKLENNSGEWCKCHCPGMITEDRYRQREILSHVPSTAETILWMCGKAEQIWNEQVFTEYRIPGTVGSIVHKTFAQKLWGIYKWNYLNGDPSINVFVTCGLLNRSH